MRAVPLRSSKDALFKSIRTLRSQEGRVREGAFLIEDEVGVRVALAHGADVRTLLAHEDCIATPPEWLAAQERTVHALGHGLVHKLFPTGKKPQVVAVCGRLDKPLDGLGAARRVLVLEDIQDAGNLGSMLRTTEGLGVHDVIVLESDVTDLYSRVAVRASMGSLFRLRLWHATREQLRSHCDTHALRLVVTTPHTERGLDAVDRGQALAIVVGNETAGVSEALASLAHERVRIPMAGEVESLNVGAACAICLHALGEQPTG